MKNKTTFSSLERGFSLLEMAVVLVILGFVLGALLLPLQAQRNQLFQSQTENTLEIAKKALLGYAQSQGRLPCPATATGELDTGSQGYANPTGGGACILPSGSIRYLPAATLGIQPTDTNGFALDAWGNRIRYAVTQSENGGTATPDFTTTNDMNTVGITALQPDIRVCAYSTAANCTATINLVDNAVAVIYSLGPTGKLASGGADENENLNIGNVFVGHEPRSANDPNGEFDHIVTWISPYVLYNAMIEAGQLH
ncbi:type II secretion system protein [Methylotenera sp.]|uniref:type II secretion system protein n=2 Tax=Methylotenera sp. TaxID=2051956 RepID=UPI002724FEF7|nr:type II secretion system protein [Methylotenera sp.]MDO9204779.1 type II secretion system protein [Methylotenera sp.]MDP3819268.1 type II secretion system protein [Methylotenera sp.]MDZ4211561.1 type II secretion system protein [Methylotenera sp.]